MIKVKKQENQSSVIVLREALARAIEPSNAQYLQLLEAQINELVILRQWTSHESWEIIEGKMREAIDTQKEYIFNSATDESPQARREVMLRTAIAECFRMILGFVTEDLPKEKGLRDEFHQRTKIDEQQKDGSNQPVSDPMLSMMRGERQ